MEWDAIDFRYRGYKIEVKSSADIQAWRQTGFSPNIFSIRKAMRWDNGTGTWLADRCRYADVYVFCHYPERDLEKLNPLNLHAWDFYVMSINAVNEHFGEQRSVALSVIRKHASHCKFDRTTIDSILTTCNKASAES